MASDDGRSSSAAPSPPAAARAVPGSYGLPVIGNARDRLDFYYFQGQDRYFESRIERYGATVLRINVPRGPFMALDPRVVALLDAKSFTVLFDGDKVDKKNVLGGTYAASTAYTGGYRVCAYLDPSEPAHGKVKQMLLSLLLARKDAVVPAFHANFSPLFAAVGVQLKVGNGARVDFNKLNDVTMFDFLGDAYYGVRPSAMGLDAAKAAKWLFMQLCSFFTLGIPFFLEEPLLHSVPLPAVLASREYKALYAYFSTAAMETLDAAEGLGLSREEACNNLLFATVFNSYGAMKQLLPEILACVGTAGAGLHRELAREIRAAVADAGGEVTAAALEKMELARSVVWETLRLNPPVRFQYGRAKADLEIESHDAVYAVKKGQLLLGYQPCATRDARVFGPTAREFVAGRFVGAEGRKLLQYVYWSNGRETEEPSVHNKQCPGKNFAELVGRLFLVELFLRYDTFTVEVKKGLGTSVAFTGITKATK